MNRLQPISFSAALLLCFIAALAGGAVYFWVGMSHSTYLVSNGVTLAEHYLDKPRYDMQLQGLIFTLAFLIAGVLLLLMIMLPDSESRAGRREAGPPQPRRRTAPQPAAEPQAAPQPAPQPAPVAQPAQPAAPPPQPPPAAQAAPGPQGPGSPLSIDAEEQEAQAAPQAAPPQPPPEPERPGVSVEEEVLQSAVAEDLPNLDFGDSRFDDTGEEDVVYGSGRITEDAVWDFVQQYPDSAVKFLYRKTLDNKPLSPTEEDIYRNWELRGMSRAKVREVVLELMSWQSLPDNYPHEIWREVRDQIYEMRTR